MPIELCQTPKRGTLRLLLPESYSKCTDEAVGLQWELYGVLTARAALEASQDEHKIPLRRSNFILCDRSLGANNYPWRSALDGLCCWQVVLH
jgi:hypothetical protein